MKSAIVKSVCNKHTKAMKLHGRNMSTRIRTNAIRDHAFHAQQSLLDTFTDTKNNIMSNIVFSLYKSPALDFWKLLQHTIYYFTHQRSAVLTHCSPILIGLTRTGLFNLYRRPSTSAVHVVSCSVSIANIVASIVSCITKTWLLCDSGSTLGGSSSRI